MRNFTVKSTCSGAARLCGQPDQVSLIARAVVRLGQRQLAKD